MKNCIFLLLLCFTSTMLAQNPFETRPQAAPAPPEEIHTDFDELPEFPGGPEAMQKYLDERISMPTMMRGVCSARKLIVGFVVEKDGSLSHIDIIKSIDGCPDFDYEVLRAVKNMPKWLPGKVKRRYVRCYFKLPVYIG